MLSQLSNLSNKLRLRLQETHNKCMRFYLQLDKILRICVKECLALNWLNVRDRYLQFIASDIFKFYINQCLNYLTELKLPFRKFKLGMQSLSYVGPSPWNEHQHKLL